MVNEAGVDFAAENYYSDLARRVYFHAQLENWTSKKTQEMLKDRQKFEKYYLAWYKRQRGIEEPVPHCVKRLADDSKQRHE